MARRVFIGRLRPRNLSSAFTLVELLVVISIIGILAALTLAAASSVMATGARNRARAEIQAMSTALESYKTDNGVYPVGAIGAGATASALTGPPSPGAYPYDLTSTSTFANYQTGSEALYQALAGKLYYNDTTFTAPGGKSYMAFKTSQLGNYKTGTAYTFVQDPFGNPYGYSTGDGQSPQKLYPNNGSGFFDLWSTGGLLTNNKNGQLATASWITNWQ